MDGLDFFEVGEFNEQVSHSAFFKIYFHFGVVACSVKSHDGAFAESFVFHSCAYAEGVATW